LWRSRQKERGFHTGQTVSLQHLTGKKKKSHFSSLTKRPRGGTASGKASYAQTDRRVVHICRNSSL